MSKKLSFISVVMLAATTTLWSSLAEIRKIAESSTVVVVPYNEEGMIIGEGSGFFVSSSGDVVTNRHVISGSFGADIKASDGRIFNVTYVIAEDKDGDLVKLATNASTGAVIPLKLASASPVVEDSVLVIASYLDDESSIGRGSTALTGIVTANRNIPGFGRIIEISTELEAGFSGSPVLNTKGQVTGVATFTVTKRNTHNFAIPSARVRNLSTTKRLTIASWEASRRKTETTTTDVLFAEGMRYMWSAEYLKALEKFTAVMEAEPLHVPSYPYIGYCQLELGNWEEAANAFNKAISALPENMPLYSELGVAYSGLGEYEKALDAFRKAIEYDPTNSRALLNAGLACAHLERYSESIEYHKRAIAYDPSLVQAHHAMGLAYEKMERWNQALEAYKKAVRLEPNDANIHFSLGRAFLALDQYTYAIGSLQQSVIIDPGMIPPYMVLGMAYAKTEDWGEAIHYIEEFCKSDSSNPEAFFIMGTANAQMKNYSQAISSFKKALSLDASLFKVHLALGEVYIEVADYENAVESLKKGLAIDTTFAPAYTSMGFAYIKLERWPEAIASYEKVVNAQPQDASAHYKLGMLYLIERDVTAAKKELEILKILDKELASELDASIFDK